MTASTALVSLLAGGSAACRTCQRCPKSRRGFFSLADRAPGRSEPEARRARGGDSTSVWSVGAHRSQAGNCGRQVAFEA